MRNLRVIDANINRVSEGLRVLEDYFRFSKEDEKSSRQLRDIKHEIRKSFTVNDFELINSRDSINDIGLENSLKSNNDKRIDSDSLIISNFKRVQEGLRSLEENFKIIDRYADGKKCEKLRFSIYNIEKRVFNSRFKLPKGLYGITASEYSKGRDNETVVKEMIKGGIKIIQYREKDKSHKEKLEECLKIREITKKNDVTFIVNDNADIAEIVGADGIHVGQDDIPVEYLKKFFPDKIIGLSTHSPEQALEAVELGVDYIGVGPIFSTKTKKDVCDPVGLEYLDYVVNNIKIPFVAIGGIKDFNIDKVISGGAETISLVTEIVGADDILKKIEKINKLFKI